MVLKISPDRPVGLRIDLVSIQLVGSGTGPMPVQYVRKTIQQQSQEETDETDLEPDKPVKTHSLIDSPDSHKTSIISFLKKGQNVGSLLPSL